MKKVETREEINKNKMKLKFMMQTQTKLVSTRNLGYEQIEIKSVGTGNFSCARFKCVFST